MHWDDMRIFLSVARTESLSAAAKALRLDPATVGRRIARLEARHGRGSFREVPARIRATAAGERLCTHAEAAEQAMSGAAIRGAGRGRNPDRHHPPWRTGWLCDLPFAPCHPRNHGRQPGLTVQIIALPRVFNLSKREADMAISVSRPRTGRLKIQKISDYSLHLAASRDYLRRAPSDHQPR